MGSGIDIKSLVSQETDEGHVLFCRQMDGEAGRGTDSCYYFYASHGGFLD
jgi:hypothetical protein